MSKTLKVSHYHFWKENIFCKYIGHFYLASPPAPWKIKYNDKGEIASMSTTFGRYYKCLVCRSFGLQGDSK